MKKTLVYEFKRVFHSSSLYMCLFVGCLIGILENIVYYYKIFPIRPTSTSIHAFVGFDGFLIFSTLYYFLMPILAALPYSSSYFQDISSGYVKNIVSKTSRKRYFVAKTIAVFTSGAIVVSIPLILNFMISMAMYPSRVPEKFEFSGFVVETSLFSYTFNTNVVVYALIYILLGAIIGGLIAVASVCISELCESRFVVLTAPFAIYTLEGYFFVFRNDAKSNFSLSEMIRASSSIAATEVKLFSIILLVIVVEVVSIIHKINRKDFL